jgi:hypothetical protein
LKGLGDRISGGKFEKTSSLAQLEGVELFRCRSEVAKLVRRYSNGRKRERGKRCSKHGIQIITRSHTDGDVWTVMLSSMFGKVRRNRTDGGLVNVWVRRRGPSKTYQHAFGRGTGAITQETTFQPFIHYNFHHELYLRSAGLLVFNSGSGVKDIPLGLGFGKVWNLADGKTINFYMEPQYSVWRSGLGAPDWQLFTGVNFQFPVHFQFWSRETRH